MIVLFKKDGTYLENLGTNSVQPAFHEKQWEVAKEDVLSRHSVAENDIEMVILDETDPENKELIKMILKGYKPNWKPSAKTEEKEQEYDEETTEKDILGENGIPTGEKETVVVKKTRKIFNKNKGMLRATTQWEKSDRLLAKEAKKTERDAVEARKEVLRAKETYTPEELQEIAKLSLK